MKWVCRFLKRFLHESVCTEELLKRPSQVPTSVVPLASVSKEGQGLSCASVQRSSLASPSPYALEHQLPLTGAPRV